MKTLTGVIALMFALMFGASNVVVAAEKAAAPAAPAAQKADPLATACKDKKPGTEVTVDGKKTKCPKPDATKK